MARVPYTPGNLYGFQWGTDDVFSGLPDTTNFFVGDAGMNILGYARGGDDVFTTGENSSNEFYGDAFLDIFGNEMLAETSPVMRKVEMIL
jgi:hypothetical protein